MISYEELHDEYLSRPTDVLIRLRDDALDMIGDAEIGTYSSELVERSFETD